MEDSYLGSKEFTNYLMLNNQTTLNTYVGYQFPQSYINILNTYRADYDDFSTQTDVVKSVDTVNLFNMMATKGNLFEEDVVSNQQTLRLSNPLVLRSTARNSIVTYNALQKVFRSRFDEGRSLTSLQHFSNISTKQPFMTDSRVPYESLLGKNRESFYNSTFYNSNLIKLINFTTNPLNTYFFEFPFLRSQDSDVSRHL
jgi:hypothetical protein